MVQGALKLILEPIFEADFQPGSFGYRPGRTAHEAVQRVAEAIVKCQTRVIDIDLRAYFDNVRHDLLLAKVAKRVSDPDVLHLLKMMLKASGQKGPRPWYSFDPGPRGSGSDQAHPGTHLRVRLPIGFVWLSTEANGP